MRLSDARYQMGSSADSKARGRDLHRFARFVVLEQLATGGMAQIMRVVDPDHPDQVFALKRLRPDWDEDEGFRQMLLDEARLVARLEHPNIARLHEVVEAEGRLGLVMELVEGVDLQRLRRYREHPWPLELAVYVVRELLEGLDFAHDVQDEDGHYLHLVHRDVSPGNVMIDTSGRVKLVDFGIAKSRTNLSRTEAGNVKGKFRYMAPEQIRGETSEPGTDVYAAAIVLWEMLVGRRIFDGQGLPQLLQAVSNARVPPLRAGREGLPEAIYLAFERAVALRAKDRFPSAKAFQEALELSLFEFDKEACRIELAMLIREARADESRLGLRRALARAKDVAGGLEGAILSALETPDRVDDPGSEAVTLPPDGDSPGGPWPEIQTSDGGPPGGPWPEIQASDGDLNAGPLPEIPTAEGESPEHEEEVGSLDWEWPSSDGSYAGYQPKRSHLDDPSSERDGRHPLEDSGFEGSRFDSEFPDTDPEGVEPHVGLPDWLFATSSSSG